MGVSPSSPRAISDKTFSLGSVTFNTLEGLVVFSHSSHQKKVFRFWAQRATKTPA